MPLSQSTVVRPPLIIRRSPAACESLAAQAAWCAGARHHRRVCGAAWYCAPWGRRWVSAARRPRGRNAAPEGHIGCRRRPRSAFAPGGRWVSCAACAPITGRTAGGGRPELRWQQNLADFPSERRQRHLAHGCARRTLPPWCSSRHVPSCWASKAHSYRDGRRGRPTIPSPRADLRSTRGTHAPP